MNQVLKRVRWNTLIDTIAFVGVESYDLMIYLAKTIDALNASVLLVDNSIDQSLTACIPGLEMNNPGEPVDYNGITAVKSLEEIPEDFDYVLIYYGKDESADLSFVNEVCLVTDYQKHNVQFLMDVQLDDEIYPFLIVRDRVASKITPESIYYELEELEIDREALIIIEDSADDLNTKVMCQYNSLKGIGKVSDSIKNFIIAILSEEYDEAAVKAAFKLVARRK